METIVNYSLTSCSIDLIPTVIPIYWELLIQPGTHLTQNKGTVLLGAYSNCDFFLSPIIDHDQNVLTGLWYILAAMSPSPWPNPLGRQKSIAIVQYVLETQHSQPLLREQSNGIRCYMVILLSHPSPPNSLILLCQELPQCNNEDLLAPCTKQFPMIAPSQIMGTETQRWVWLGGLSWMVMRVIWYVCEFVCQLTWAHSFLCIVLAFRRWWYKK